MSPQPVKLTVSDTADPVQHNCGTGTFEHLESVDAPISFQPQLTTIAALPVVQQVSTSECVLRRAVG